MKVEQLPGAGLFARAGEELHALGLRLRRGTKRAGVEPVEVESPSAALVDSLTMVSRWSAALAFLVGYHGLLGWIFRIPLLRSPRVDIPPMTGHSAIAASLAGGALFLYQLPPHILRARRDALISVAGVVVALLGLSGLFTHLSGEPAPAFMTLVSALAFIVIGCALVVLGLFRDHAAAELLGLVTAALSSQAIASFVFGAQPFPGAIPLYTALAVLFLSLALVLVRPDEGFMAKVSSDSFGGVMARRLLPAAILVPFVLSWLQLLGQAAGLYTIAPGEALYAVTTSIVFVAVVWWSVNSLYRMDTKRRLAERELKETAARLSASNADLEQFAYVASHDLKEPLRAISGSIQVLQSRLQDRLGADGEEIIRHTVDGANRMQTLIDDLLTYSRLTTREAPLETVECEEILQEVRSNLEVPIRESRAVLTHDPLPMVRADRTQLLQVFQNLVSNGIKYRSERTPKIHVSAEDKGDHWLFSVRDNGIGIAPQYQDRIFKIFQRLHTRKDYPGTGIGLAVCKKVIERHGGRIWVESEPEEGSTFSFTLPKATT